MILLTFSTFEVLTELDELKKRSEGARNSIKWLEHEFSKGNRFLRTQRDDEKRKLSFLKTPKKLGIYLH